MEVWSGIAVLRRNRAGYLTYANRFARELCDIPFELTERELTTADEWHFSRCVLGAGLQEFGLLWDAVHQHGAVKWHGTVAPSQMHVLAVVQQGPPTEESIEVLIFVGQDAREWAEARRTLKRLTARELEIAQLVAEGYTSQNIGARLGISPRTVDAHRARISAKTACQTPVELTKLVLVGTRHP